MFAGTEKREFCCLRCKRKEEKRKYYWGDVLGIPANYWPATRDQDGNIIKSEDDLSPKPKRQPPLLGLTEALILRQALTTTEAQRPLGLLEEDKEATALQEKTSHAHKTKRRKRKKKSRLGNPTKRSTKRGPSLRKDLVAQGLGGLCEGESDTGSVGSDWYSSEEDEVRKNLPWWEAKNNCQRCVYHHETHKKWRPPQSPKSENMRMHTQKIMRSLLARKDILDNPSLGLLLKKWWGGNLTCKKCKDHHEGDEYNTCSRAHNERDIDSTIPKSEGLFGIDGQTESLPTYNPNNPPGLGEIPGVNTIPAGENLLVNTLPTSNPNNINDRTSRSHVLSPCQQFANKCKEKNLSLRWWQPDTDCKKCTSHHRALKNLKLVLGDTKVDTILEPQPSKGIHDLTNLEDPGDIYLPHDHGFLDSGVTLLENDAKIKASLKPINTSRKVEVKLTLPCSLHSQKIFQESKQKALAKATGKQVKDIPKWWELEVNCERCSHHHKAHQKPRTRVISPERMANGHWKQERILTTKKETKEDCMKCLHHHEASGKLRTSVPKGVVEWKKEHEEEPLLHTRPKRDSKTSNMKKDGFMNSDSKPKWMNTNVSHLPHELSAAREVKQDTMVSSRTPISKMVEKELLSVIREVEQDSLTSSSTATPETKERQAIRSIPQELQSKLDTFSRNYLSPNEEAARGVQERREEMYNAHAKGHPFSRSSPNLNCEIGVQTLPVQISEKPKPFTESERNCIEHKIKNPWIELQAPTPREELRRLRAKEHDLNKRRSLVEKKLKRAERIRQLTKEADEREIREAFTRAPRITPAGYKWRENLRNEQESTSDSSKSKPLHRKEFNVLGKGRARPITPPSVKGSNSSNGTPRRNYLRRKREMSQIKPKDPSQHVERRKHKSDHRHKPKLNNKTQDDSTPKFSEIPKTTQDDLNKDHASIQLNGDDPNPKLEGAPLSTWLAHLINVEEKVLGCEKSCSARDPVVSNSILSVCLNLVIEGLLSQKTSQTSKLNNVS